MNKQDIPNTHNNEGTAVRKLPHRPLLLLIYNVFLSLYYAGIAIYSLFNGKAKKWMAGRVGWQQVIKNALQPGEKRIWIHCSSIGEYEQGRPVTEALKDKYPGHKIVLTFFSPSGYEATRKNSNIDYIFYLPQDGKSNAAQFIDLIDPALVIFVKYEFWYHYLAQLQYRQVPVLLVSGAFRQGQPFFKWYGGLFRDMLCCFTFFFLQDEASATALHTIGIRENIAVSGDTRYDRVSAIAKNTGPLPLIEQFKDDNKILIAGSTWPADEDVLKECIALLPADWKLIIAPHEVDEAHISSIQRLFGQDMMLYSELSAGQAVAGKKIMVINNIGMLSRLYAYGDVAYVGGGFKKAGIHNILEPAVFGLPVIFGPVYKKFVEANELSALHLAFPINNTEDGKAILEKLITDTAYRKSVSTALKSFMQAHTGATAAVLHKTGEAAWLS